MKKNTIFILSSGLFLALTMVVLACNNDDPSTLSLKYAGCCKTEPVIYNNSLIRLYIPNAFFPEFNDGSGRFGISGNSDVGKIHIYSFRIYDQGKNEILKEYTNIIPNDPYNSWWDGDYPNGQPYEGLFYYEAQIRLIQFDTISSQYYLDTLYLQGNGCSIRCQEHNEASNLKSENCTFSSQHDGNGGFEPALPIDSPDCW